MTSGASRKLDWILATLMTVGLAALLVGASWVILIATTFGCGGDADSPAETFCDWLGDWGYLLPPVGAGAVLVVGLVSRRAKYMLISAAAVFAMDVVLLVLRSTLPS